jgi:hypothetical protein
MRHIFSSSRLLSSRDTLKLHANFTSSNERKRDVFAKAASAKKVGEKFNRNTARSIALCCNGNERVRKKKTLSCELNELDSSLTFANKVYARRRRFV